MSLLIRKFQPSQIVHVRKILSAIQARHDHWCPNNKPGPYPKTKEEREAAAKKYNMLPEEYEPYPDDGNGFGDYPALPYESVCSRDPYYRWDDEELRRNFMDPVHFRIVNLLPEQDPVDYPQSFIAKELFFYHIIPVAVCALILYLLGKVHFHHGLEKQYPQPGIVHYTFDLDYDKAKSN